MRAWGVLEVDAFSDQCHHSSPSRHSFSGSRFADRCESSKGDGFVGWGQFGFLEARDVDFVLQHEVFEFAGLTMAAVAVPLQYFQLILCLIDGGGGGGGAGDDGGGDDGGGDDGGGDDGGDDGGNDGGGGDGGSVGGSVCGGEIICRTTV